MTENNVRNGMPPSQQIPIPQRGQHAGAPASPPIQETSPDQAHSADTAAFSLLLGTPIAQECSYQGKSERLYRLPRPVPHFVNRNREIRDIKRYLSPEEDCRCVLVLGAVGIGKTATAIKAANEILEANPDQTVVVYVNCRYTASLDDLATVIGKQLHHLPLNKPADEVKTRLIKEEEKCIVLLLDNFEWIKASSENAIVNKFITEIVQQSGQINLLITSSDTMVFPPETCTKQIRLPPFCANDSFELLKKLYGDTPLEKETAHKIAHICSGIPLVLRSLASWEDHPPTLVEMFTGANPKQHYELFKRIPTATEENKISVCLEAGFSRLDVHLQDTLVSLTVFRGLFRMSRAVKVFQSEELRRQIPELARKSFLEKNVLNPTAFCLFSFLTVIQIFCQNKAMDMDTRFHRVVSDARRLFIEHYLSFLKVSFKAFLGNDVSQAIVLFREEDENILQLINWLDENSAMSKEHKQKCIDVFNEVGELLAKMVGKKKFEKVFTLLKDSCKDMKDQKRLSECLTSLGIKEVFSCSCSPSLCHRAAEGAKKYLMKADKIQSALGINTGNSRAQCLAKLGRCLAKDCRFREAKEKIQLAINIRKAQGKKDIVMLGATYNDLAVALTLERKHQQAIEVREQQTLPIYKKHLGDHPFTATILNNLSNNYYELDEYDIAKQYSEEALAIRRELLKEHRDTAKSLFDLGMVHKKKEEFEQAKKCLEECEAMQMKVLDDNTTDHKRTREQLDEVLNLLGELRLEEST